MLRLLTLNLQHAQLGALAPAPAGPGADPRDPRAAREVLVALAGQLAALGPDVIALQEVDLGQARSGRLNQVAELASALGWPHHRLAATYAGGVTGLRRRPRRSGLTRRGDDVLGPALAAAGRPLAGFGNALLSRYPVAAWHVRRLGRGPALLTRRGGAVGRGQLRAALDPRSYRLETSTARVLLAARVSLPTGVLPGAGGLAVGSTHLATRPDVAAAQLAGAWAALTRLPGPHALAGDLNLRPEEVRSLGVGRLLGEGPTYPADGPRYRIDHVLTDPWPLDAHGRPLVPGPRDAGGAGWSGAVPGAAGGAVPGAGGPPLASDAGHRIRDAVPGAGGPPAGAPSPGVHLVARDWGSTTLLVSDHAATWVDLETVGV